MMNNSTRQSTTVQSGLNADHARKQLSSGPAFSLGDSNGDGRSSRGFKDLIVWQRGIELTNAVYELTAEFPVSERFGLSSQMRRAAISVPSNVAEGYGRRTTGEFKQSVCMARGSNCEIETQLIIVRNLGFGSDRALSKTDKLCADVSRLLRAFLRSLEERKV